MSPPTPSRRHVWVDVSGGYACPGLVMAWRRVVPGWEAQVAVVRDRTVFVQWVAATALHPVVDDAWSTDPDPGPRRGPSPPPRQP